MNNKTQIFKNSIFGELRVMTIDGEPYFSATDCAKILGYTNPQEAIRSHCKGVRKILTPTAGGKQQINYIPESDLYRLITHSKLPAAKKFEKFVYETVLPSIRKHGAYVAPDVLDEIIVNPQFAENLLRKLKSEQSTNMRLKEHIKYMTPRARFCDRVLNSESLLPITLIAKDYGFSAVAFNRLLHDFGIQYKVGGKGAWVLYAEYADRGYTKTRTYPISETETSTHTYWTLAGYKFIFEFLKFYGILPTEPTDIGDEFPSLAEYGGGNDLFEI